MSTTQFVYAIGIMMVPIIAMGAAMLLAGDW